MESVGKAATWNCLDQTKEETPSGRQRYPLVPIETEGDVLENARRHARGLRNIKFDESTERAKKRQAKQISYEANWEVQERANKDHRGLVALLAKKMKRHGIIPKANNMDLLAEKHRKILIFEAKTIHVRNFISQTRRAIGQILEYEHFDVRKNPQNRGKDILRGILYNRKPYSEIIEFLRAYGFNVFWSENGEVIGDRASIAALAHFVR